MEGPEELHVHRLTRRSLSLPHRGSGWRQAHHLSFLRDGLCHETSHNLGQARHWSWVVNAAGAVSGGIQQFYTKDHREPDSAKKQKESLLTQLPRLLLICSNVVGSLR